MRTYWINLYTPETWGEYVAHGSKCACFRESMRKKGVEKVKGGDVLLAYVTGISRFVGAQEVVGPAYFDESRIYSSDVFSARLPIQPLVELKLETGVPIKEFLDELSIYDASNPNAWTGRLRGSPSRWPEVDGALILDKLTAEAADPVIRPLPKRVAQNIAPYQSEIGAVTVPDDGAATPPEEATKQSSLHDQVQFALLELGSSLGLDVWVARNDRSKSYMGAKFADIPRMKTSLPRMFDEATNRTIELIDVLWWKGNVIVAAFEIESTTSIYSGLLRMGDLIAMQPNSSIPLYLVAPDDRRSKVFEEVNRPTFRRLEPPLSQVCRYISVSALLNKVAEAKPVLQFVKHEILESIAEDCSAESSQLGQAGG